MFGIAVAALSGLSEEEKAVYKRAYCGLCYALKRDFGAIGSSTLNYDLTFLELLYDSLYEPPIRIERMRCVSHPLEKRECGISEFSDYCALLSVALAYHKCLDDIADENSIPAKGASLILKKAYEKASSKLPGHCLIIEEAMSAIRRIEEDPDSSMDAASKVFAEMLSFCFECVPGHYPDIWSGDLCRLGYWLGRFIYMMDAAIDYRDDLKKGAYNPFFAMGWEEPDPEFMRDVLSIFAANAADVFERMPIVENAHLLRGVLYQGIWQKFNKEYRP